MAATEVYTQIRQFISRHVDAQVDQSTRDRLAWVVTGMIQAQTGAPAQIAAGLDELVLRLGTAPSLERRIRRFENDAEVSAVLCVQPLACERFTTGHFFHGLNFRVQ